VSDLLAPDIVEHESRMTFDRTIERLTTVIADHGMTIFARIDHAANAREIGLSMPPATVFIYGNARGGTPIMRDTPLAALDLPLRVLVREREDGSTVMAFHPVVTMLHRTGVAPASASRLEPAQHMLIEGLAP
jgi:uncharacterized protein (DUF302 family)